MSEADKRVSEADKRVSDADQRLSDASADHRLIRIVQAGDPVLRQVAQPLTRDQIRSAPVQRLIERMRATMHAAPGVGLAAPQVGTSWQLAVIEDRAENLDNLAAEDVAARRRRAVPFHVLVNPVLQVIDAESVVFHEGCLSVEGFTAAVPRVASVRVDALDHRGEPVTVHADGWYARILQHEIDHLNGMLYLDRMDPRTFGSPSERALAATRRRDA